ncbi:hypothetical protein OGAPHI_001471 [Ogataea philodendri]|uniref:Uncharacterized protein n=1 Tax=Ogataea philodendri TaxID=1378263 RepID=A0A9P8T8M0_9ASCO|nr:uncharacterized protein OGAPHI_001471 [Ogataea philodendri]KAH3669350.1 hypothetical protein OGAPHI_001471 [Ogataea philodendri]
MRSKHAGLQWTINWDLGVVSSQSVSVGVWVREQSRLQNRVIRWLHSWNCVRWREGDLLSLGKVVLWVLVQGESTKVSQWEVLVRPDLGKIKHREWNLLGLFQSHCLDVALPRWVVTSLNCLVEVSSVEIWVFSSELSSLIVKQVMHTLVRDEVDLNVCSWVSFLSVDEVRELGWIPNKENRGVIVNQVQVSVLGVELGSKSSWVSGRVCRTFLTTDGGESGENSGLLTNSVQELGGTHIGDVISDFENTVGTRTLGMDNSLWNSFSVEMSKRVDQLKVLEIPFESAQQAKIAQDSLNPDSTLKPDQVQTSFSVSENVLQIVFDGVSERAIRVAANNTIENLKTVLECMEEFEIAN